ncbi:hypothetical protein BH23PLA1_BH23PLA1_43930 [soil metagenome]
MTSSRIGAVVVTGWFLMAAWSSGSAALAGAAEKEGQYGPAFSIEEGCLKIPGIGPDNPVIYDNDWWLDVIDATFCAAQHKLGRLDLKGFIVTRDMWRDPPNLYSLEDSVRDFNEFRELALASGLHTVPESTAGAAERLKRPESGKISETKFAPTAGSDLIIREAMKASADKPLVIVVGGAPTTVTTALLQEPAIAERILVLWLAIRQYNANDEWAAHVMLQRSPVIHYDFQLRDGLTREMLASLPDNPINRRFKESNLVLDNGVGDGVLLTWLFDHCLITGAEKQVVTDLVGYRPTSDSPYGFLHIPNQHKRSLEIAEHMVNVLREPEVSELSQESSCGRHVE